nr:NTP transferase domain-containing protein [uncultured Sphaerochaeta sp.]
MNVIILNSGKGSRLEELTENRPKGLVPLSSKETILSRQIDLLTKCKVERIFITTGYLSQQFVDYCSNMFPDLAIEFVYNNQYDTTNYIVSLDRLANEEFSDPVLLMHGDLVFSQDVLCDILKQEGSCVVVDGNAPIPQKDFKARINSDGMITEIGINVFGPDCLACQPLYKLTSSDWKEWQLAIRNWCEDGKTSVYAEDALNSILSSMQLVPFDAKGRLCREVDTKEDLSVIQSIL